MPVSVLGFGLGVFMHGVGTAQNAAAFYWLWALKNWLAGPLTGDAGIITFALYMLGQTLKWDPHTRAASAILLAANYGAPFALLQAKNATALKLVRKLKKGEGWVEMFEAYLAMGAIFWGYVAVMHMNQAH
jgi:hypothetical protein